MITLPRLFYTLCAALGGSAAGGYVAYAIASRFAFISELNDRTIVEPHVLIVLCIAGGFLAFPLGAAAGLFAGVLLNRGFDFARRARPGGDDASQGSWVTRRSATEDQTVE